MAWLRHVLQEGAIRYKRWNEAGLTISKVDAYECYKEFSKEQHDWRPEIKDLWSKKIHTVLGSNVTDPRLTNGNDRVRSFQFAPLPDCQRQFASYLGAPNLEWEELENEPKSAPGATIGQPAEDIGQPTDPDALHDAQIIEGDPELEPELDNSPEYEPEDE